MGVEALRLPLSPFVIDTQTADLYFLCRLQVCLLSDPDR
jgi:hypothetical protein